MNDKASYDITNKNRVIAYQMNADVLSRNKTVVVYQSYRSRTWHIMIKEPSACSERHLYYCTAKRCTFHRSKIVLTGIVVSQ
jgi:hypothetical protein